MSSPLKGGGLILLSAMLMAAGAGDFVFAQPAPSFRAGCATVREELAKLDPPADTLVTIDVVGKLTLVEFDGAIAYLGVCGSPTPQVMCIGYSIEGWNVGDPAILTGGYNPGSGETIVLDPCLPSHPGAEDMKLIEQQD